MRLVYTRRFPRPPYAAITLFGVVFTWRHNPSRELLNHERIHCRQQLEWLYIPFFVLYGIEWLWWMIKTRDTNRAYHMISFEREAYAHEHDLNYLKHRRPYSNYRKITKKT